MTRPPAKSPAFQFYPDDFLGSGKVGTMTAEEIGAYTLLLCLEWNETGFVFDEEELSRWCRMPRAKFRAAWRRVSRCFVERDGRMFNPRLDVERAKQAEWREKSRQGGRKSGLIRSKGGSTVVEGWLKGGSTTDPTKHEPPPQPNANQTPTLLSPSPTPSPVTTKKPSAPSDAEREVLEFYRTTHPSRRGSKKDLPAVRKLLAEGRTVDDLKAAITGNAQSEWHAERHMHTLAFVLRDDQIDTFIAKGQAATPRLAVDPVTRLPNAVGIAALGGRK